MRTHFRNRGHFCNYYRKVLENKCIRYRSSAANPLIWFAWKEPHFREQIIEKLMALKYDGDSKAFNEKLQEIADDYHHLPGFGTK